MRIFSIPKWVICQIRSIYYTNKIDTGGGKIIITDPFLKFRIHKEKSALLIVKGVLKVTPHMGGNNAVYIHLSINSCFQLDNDFILGQGVRIFLAKNAFLHIGGKDKESLSGITSDTLIMVYQKIEIGKDFVCAWSVFISDCDWHQIEGQSFQKNVRIGDHVWIANNNNILKGTIIGDNSIVASNSKIINKTFPDNVLIAGIVPQIVKTSINWNRDL
ncbi:MAG: hypothetical protein JXB49_36700 [Bacteroidales bacterium]|nr:hypothetical protein [Bacteroidales bacterium]